MSACVFFYGTRYTLVLCVVSEFLIEIREQFTLEAPTKIDIIYQQWCVNEKENIEKIKELVE